ncbi:MAG: response regulator [Clostridia bacterium]
MYRLVIADDEQFIIQLIRNLIDAQRLGIEIVGEATGGVMAFEMVETLHPDILITDIRMPCVDGLMLIEKIRAKKLPVSVIAISGHRQFDYVYNALKHGVEDFVVKPINRKDLNDALEKICLKRQSETATSTQLRDMEQTIKSDASALRACFIADCLSGTLQDMPLARINEAYRFDFEPGEFIGIAIRPDIAISDSAAIIGRCKNVIEQNLRSYCIDMEIIFDEGLFVGLLNTRMEEAVHLIGKIKKLFETLTLTLEVYDASFSIGLGAHVKRIQDISLSVCEARASARSKCVMGAQRIYQSEKQDIQHMNAQLSATQVDRLRVLMETGAPGAGIEVWLGEVFDKSEDYYRENPIEALALVDSATLNFQKLCDMREISVDASATRRWLCEMENARSFAQMRACLATYITKTMEMDYNLRLQRELYPVKRAKAYIADHLSSSLKLENIADSAMISPGYLSTLFKKETGEAISEYILQLRLDEARRLLRDTSLNIGEIAGRVGYTDPKHFSKMFHQQTGSRPMEYRRLYSW